MTTENKALDLGKERLKSIIKYSSDPDEQHELQLILDALSSKPQKVDWEWLRKELSKAASERFGGILDVDNKEEIDFLIDFLRSRIDQQQTQPKGGQG